MYLTEVRARRKIFALLWKKADSYQEAAYSSMSREKAAKRHLDLVTFLSQSEYLEDHIFEAADHLLTARSLGQDTGDSKEAVKLLLEAASRAAYATSFALCKAYIDSIESKLYITLVSVHKLIVEQK